MLEGFRIVDLCHVVAGASATQLMADLGADVVKIEPPEGEILRRVGHRVRGVDDDLPLSFLGVSRNKRSLAVDLKSPDGLAIAGKLISQCDALVTNLRYGVLSRLGLGYEAASQLNPAIVYCQITGLGERGPETTNPGQDALAQARGGLMSFQGRPDMPVHMGSSAIDRVCGLQAAYGVLASLLHRDRTGQGQLVFTSLLDAALYLQPWEISEHLNAGVEPQRVKHGHYLIPPPYGVYTASDGRHLVIVGAHAWEQFCSALGLQDLQADSRFSTEDGRMRHRDELGDALALAVARFSRDDLLQILRQAGIWAEPVPAYSEVFADPQVTENDMLVEIQHPHGARVRLPGHPVRYSTVNKVADRFPPRVGEDTRELLEELGYARADIDALEVAGIVRCGTKPESVMGNPQSSPA